MPDRICIVGSGPSLSGIDPRTVSSMPGIHVIAVNGAAEWLPRFDTWFTLDPSTKNLQRCARAIPGVEYVIASPPNFSLRIPPHVRILKRVQGERYGRAKAPGGLSDDPNAINTGNSGFGALNLAYHMRPKKIILLGIDADHSQPRITGGYSRSLEHLPDLFQTACPQLKAAGIQVATGSLISKVTCFPQVSPRQALEWLIQ